MAQPADARRPRARAALNAASALPLTISPKRSAPARSISPARSKWMGCRPCRRAGCSGCWLWSRRQASKQSSRPSESWVSWARERDHAPAIRSREAARAETAVGSAAAQIERDPHRTMDRQSVRDLRARHLEARTSESARRRARRGFARSDHPSRLAGILARSSRSAPRRYRRGAEPDRRPAFRGAGRFARCEGLLAPRSSVASRDGSR